jgi:formylglycine-generating enzyme required for sulfatase activity
MNFKLVGKQLALSLSVIALAMAVYSCGGPKNSKSGGKTLSSAKGGSKGKGLLSFGKQAKEAPGVENGEIVAASRKGWSQPTPYGMVLVPSGSFMMGHADEDP